MAPAIGLARHAGLRAVPIPGPLHLLVCVTLALTARAAPRGPFGPGGDAAGGAVQCAVRDPLALWHDIRQSLAEHAGACPGDRQRAGVFRPGGAERDHQRRSPRRDLCRDGAGRGAVRPPLAARGWPLFRPSRRPPARSTEPRAPWRISGRRPRARLVGRRGGACEPPADRRQRFDHLQRRTRQRRAGGQGRAARARLARRRCATRHAGCVRHPSPGQPCRYPQEPDRGAGGVHPRALATLPCPPFCWAISTSTARRRRGAIRTPSIII